MSGVTQDDAIQMYARFLTSRHGPAAADVARGRAQFLTKTGDSDGVAVWNKVAHVIENIRSKQRVAALSESEH